MKFFLSLFLLILTLNTIAGQVVRIDFTPYTLDDIDVFFKKGFEGAGYESFINYFGRSAERPFDLLFRYEYDGNVMTGSLYTNEEELLKRYQQKIIYSDRVERLIYKFLEKLLETDIDVQDMRGRIRYDYDILTTEIVKLDSAVYIVSVSGSENVSAEKVRLGFLHAAQFLTNEFRTYFEGSYYLYERGESWQPSSQLIGWRVKGIVLGEGMAGLGSIILPIPPKIYLDYQQHLTEGLTVPWKPEGTNGQSIIYVLRNSSRSADSGPDLVYLDGKVVCRLNHGKFAAIPVQPGLHVLTVKHPDFNPKKKLEELQLNVKPYQDSYVSIIWGFHVGIIYQEVKKYEAIQLIQGLEEEACR